MIKETAWKDFFVVRDHDGNEIAFAVTDADRHTIDPWHAAEESPGDGDDQ